MRSNLLTLLLCGIVSQAASETVDSISKTVIIAPVEVTETRVYGQYRYMPVSMSIITREDIEKRNESSLLPLLNENVPGFFATQRGIMGYGLSANSAGGIKMRGIGGAPTTEMLILLDGQPQYMGLMAHTVADQSLSMLAERVEVMRGPSSVLYGSNAMGGAMNIVTRRQATDAAMITMQASVASHDTYTTNTSFNIKEGPWSAVATGLLGKSKGHRQRMKFEQSGGYAKVGYLISPGWQLAADGGMTYFYSQNPGITNAPMFNGDVGATRSNASIALSNRIGSKFSGALTLYGTWGSHRVNDGNLLSQDVLDFRYRSRDDLLGISFYEHLNLWKDGRITAGIDYQRMGGRAWNEFNDGREVPLADKYVNTAALYAQMQQRIDFVIFDAGLRVDNHSQVGTELIPEAGVSLNLPGEALLRFSANKGFRYPTIKELYMFRPKNPDLKPERLWNYEVSLSQTIEPLNLNYEVTMFLIDGENLIQTEFINGSPINLNVSKVKNWGIESVVNYSIDKNWTINANYSFLDMKYKIVSAPKQKLYAEVKYQRDALRLSSGIQYVGGLYTSSASNHKENYTLFNIRAEYKLFQCMNVYARGENLFNQKYETYAGFPMPRATATLGVKINLDLKNGVKF